MFINKIIISTIQAHSPLLANVMIHFNYELIVNEIRILQRDNHLELSMPKIKSSKTKAYYNIVSTIDNSFCKALHSLLFSAYEMIHIKQIEKACFLFKENSTNNLLEQTLDDFDLIYEDNELVDFAMDLPKLQITKAKLVYPKKHIGYAFIELEFDSMLVIKSLRLSKNESDVSQLFMPKITNKNGKSFDVLFLSNDLHNRIKETINVVHQMALSLNLHQVLCEFDEKNNTYIEPGSSNLMNNQEWSLDKTDSNLISSIEERIFRTLWNSSENGILLRSQIIPLLNAQKIDWENTFQVSNLEELLLKLPYISSPPLESCSVISTDWVILSTERKETTLTLGTKVSQNQLSKAQSEELQLLLSNMSQKKNGDILISEIVPYIRQVSPTLAETLRNHKLMDILRQCDFVQLYVIQRDDGFIQNWAHIELSNFNEEPSIKKQNVLPEEINFSIQDIKESSSAEFPVINDETEKNKQVRETDEFGRVKQAMNNPFRYFPNSVLKTKFEYEQLKANSEEITVIQRDNRTSGLAFETAFRNGIFGEHEIDILTWISRLQYCHDSILIDLIKGEYIKPTTRFNMTKTNIKKNLERLYKYQMIDIYFICALDNNCEIVNDYQQHIYTVNSYGFTLLKDIGRIESAVTYNRFFAFQDANAVKQILSLNQWCAKWLSLAKTNDLMFWLNQIHMVKLDAYNGARINVAIQCNQQPFFAQAVRRGPDKGNMYLKKDYIEKVQRVINIIQNYKEIYCSRQKVNYTYRPILVLLCEDEEHCKQFFQSIRSFIFTKGGQLVVEVWFACDLNVYNDFYHAHFTYNFSEEKVIIDLSNYCLFEDEKLLPALISDFCI